MKTLQQLGICCDHCLSHWPILLLIIFLCLPICQSICIHWVCLVSFYSISSLEQRFLVGFTVRFPKYKNSTNSSNKLERRLAQYVCPMNRRFIVSLILFITKNPLTERVCCPTADLCVLYHSMKLLWRFVWSTEFFHSSSKDCSMQKINRLMRRSRVCFHSTLWNPAFSSCLRNRNCSLSHIQYRSTKDDEKHQYNQFYSPVLVNPSSFSSNIFAL